MVFVGREGRTRDIGPVASKILRWRSLSALFSVTHFIIDSVPLNLSGTHDPLITHKIWQRYDMSSLCLAKEDAKEEFQ